MDIDCWVARKVSTLRILWLLTLLRLCAIHPYVYSFASFNSHSLPLSHVGSSFSLSLHLLLFLFLLGLLFGGSEGLADVPSVMNCMRLTHGLLGCFITDLASFL